MLADFAANPTAPEALKANYAALTKWMGYNSPDERAQAIKERAALAAKKSRTSAEESRLEAITRKEERLSHGFEQYLAGGKPPTMALARTFQRFRQWMFRVYKVANGPAAQYQGEFGKPLDFSDDARRVFDRWFAADQAVTDARAGSDPFAELVAKMTPEERAAYEKTSQEAHEAAVLEVVRAVAQAQHEEVSGFIARAREGIRQEAEQQLDTQPTYAALRYLQQGDTVQAPGETPEDLRGEGGAPMKLSRPELVKRYGADFVRTLPKGIFAAKGDEAHAMSSDAMSDAFNFTSGDELVKAIQSATPRAQAIEAEVQRRLEATYGPELLQDPQRLAELAAQAVTQEGDLQRTFQAIQSLRRQLGAPGEAVLTPEHAAALAERYVDGKTVGELTRGEQGLAGAYRRNAEAAGRRAAEAFRAGNLHHAEREMDTQLLNQALARRASELRREMERAGRKLEQLTGDAGRKAMGNAEPAFREASDVVLQALGFAEAEQGYAPSIEPLVALAGENLQGAFAFDADLMRRLITDKRPWKKLSIAEARAVVEGLGNIRHVASFANKLNLRDRTISDEEFFAQLEREVQGTGRKPVAPEDYNEHAPVGRITKATAAVRGFKADLTEMGNIIAKLGPREGVAAKLFVDARRDARDREVEIKRRILQAVGEKYEALPKDMKRGADDPVDVKLPLPPDPDRPLNFTPTRKWLWALFINWGNEGNRQRIRDGNGWKDEQVQEALDLLTPEEAEYLQGVLDVTNSLFPDLAKVHEQRTGLPLAKVEASPIRVKGREWAGGYAPLKYDVRFAGDVARRQVASEIDQILPNDYRSPVSNGSYTKSRAEKVAAPVRISWDTIPAHLAQVAHDIAYGDWVRQVARLLNDKKGRFDRILNTYLGPELAKQFRPWLADVARDQSDSLAGATAPFWEGASAKMRRFVAVGATMFNVQSYARHLFDPFAAVSKTVGVPLKLIADAYRQAVTDKSNRLLGRATDEWRSALYEQSQVLRYREASHEDGIRKVFAEAGVKRGLSGAMVRMDAHIRAGIGTVVDQTIFLAAYKHALAQGMTHEEAIRHGDDVVTRTTPSFDVAERPALLRSKRSIAGAIMLMGYRAKMFGLHEQAWSESAMNGFATTVQLIAVGAVGSLLVHMGKRDDEGWAGWGFEQALEETLGLIPLAGDIGISMLQGKQVDASRLPEARWASQVGNAMTSLVTKWGDGETGWDKAWESLELYLALTGGPLVAAGQAKKAAVKVAGQ